MTQFNELQQVKRHFFAMRNGVIADTLRKAGSPYRIIFGLNLPQIAEIAEMTPHTVELATALWNNTSTRESMLIAPMLYPVENYTDDLAMEWLSQSPTAECTDILCHRLLRHMPDSYGFGCRLAQMTEPAYRYAAMRLLWHFIGRHPEDLKKIFVKEYERNDPHTRTIACQAIDETDYLCSL